MTATDITATAATLEERGDDMSLWPTDRGPWFDSTPGGIYDRGAVWCATRDTHPQNMPDKYPHPDHGPSHYCWTPQYPHLSEAREGINGHPVFLRAFMVTPFQFGEPAGPPPWQGPRLLIDFAVGDDDAKAVSMSLGDAVLLIRHLNHAVDTVLGHTIPGATS